MGVDTIVTEGKIAMSSAPAPLLKVDGLTVDIGERDNSVRLVDGVSFTIRKGERVALVGESGSGKSVTAQAIMRLNSRVRLSGRIDFAGTDVLGLSPRQMTALRT